MQKCENAFEFLLFFNAADLPFFRLLYKCMQKEEKLLSIRRSRLTLCYSKYWSWKKGAKRDW